VGATISTRDCEIGLIFKRLEIGKPTILQGYVDVDYVRDLDQQRFMTGYVFTIAECPLVGRQSCKIQFLF